MRPYSAQEGSGPAAFVNVINCINYHSAADRGALSAADVWLWGWDMVGAAGLCGCEQPRGEEEEEEEDAVGEGARPFWPLLL